ncbi:TIGR03862 family flavoprotein [Histidinibacterium lentulum]|uniref:TIGR03862 family flavoprotein n=1 Tax=Histidinibacterium lentulum TaxID=2480588 RepID=A0A3N2R672_9RHOB|nr:TIGR03862 family flavoprotein [Histidinibacterium lentulum]ROU02969.1 TIGR03862 family flavoprotein [Histidinibacterium lentulum]
MTQPDGKPAPDALVVGAGPAGLMAADTLSAAGLSVLMAEAMPSPGRKFLMAGKSGLNLTKAEPPEAWRAAFGSLPGWFADILTAFGPTEAMTFARGLGQELFTGSTGRVFPVAMKASPMLRAWLVRLENRGVDLRRRWRWQGWQEGAHLFGTPEGPVRLSPRVAILAMGGASWRRLGSDGAWVSAFDTAELTPFAPANAGLSVRWSAHMARHFGSPLKSCALHAGNLVSRGECTISARGLEGGGLYPLTPALRTGASLILDLCPDLSPEAVTDRLSRPRGKASLANHLRRTLGLDPAKQALLNEFARPLPADLAPLVKALPIRHAGLRPMDEAISTAGGVRLDAVDDTLMLRAHPGTWVAGEMLDWEAPTGGYLITACLATGRHAARAAMLRATSR